MANGIGHTQIRGTLSHNQSNCLCTPLPDSDHKTSDQVGIPLTCSSLENCLVSLFFFSQINTVKWNLSKVCFSFLSSPPLPPALPPSPSHSLPPCLLSFSWNSDPPALASPSRQYWKQAQSFSVTGSNLLTEIHPRP